MNPKITILTMCLLITLIANLSFAQTLNSNQIVDNVQSFYTNVEDYKARFVQTTAHKMFPGKYQRAYGNVMFKKGGLMRWEYKRPENKYFIYDGTILWIYEPTIPQIFKGQDNTERLQKALAFLTGEGRIKDFYTAKKATTKKYGYKKGYVLILTPKEDNSPFSHVELYVDKKTFRVSRSVVVDHEKNRNRLDFHGVKTNSNLNIKMFKFTPPAGVPVLTP